MSAKESKQKAETKKELAQPIIGTHTKANTKRKKINKIADKEIVIDNTANVEECMPECVNESCEIAKVCKADPFEHRYYEQDCESSNTVSTDWNVTINKKTKFESIFDIIKDKCKQFIKYIVYRFKRLF